MQNATSCPACRNYNRADLSIVVLFVSTVTETWLQNYEDIILRLKSCGHKVEAVDLTDFSYPPQVIDLREGFARLDLSVDIKSPKGVKVDKSDYMMDIEEKHDAISSELLTKYRGPLGLVWQPLIYLEKFLLSSTASTLFKSLHKFAYPKSLWIVPNGRLAHQRAVASFALQNEIPLLYLEESLVSQGSYLLRPYGVHDRISFQKDALSMKRWHSSEHLAFARDWYLDRESNTSISNPFSSNFIVSEAKERPLSDTSKQCVIFTSSDDEFRTMGSSWSRLGWTDQYESFGHVSQTLTGLGYRVTLRVHPNLSTKSTRTIKSEYKSLLTLLKYGVSEVLGPQSPTNSYRLMKDADVVVVSVSTTGLEAIYRRRKVIATANNHFDLLGECLVYSASSDSSEISSYLDADELNGESALHWVANQRLQDYMPLRPRQKLPPNHLFQKLKFVSRPSVQLYFLSLWLVNLMGLFPRKYYLWRIANLSKRSSSRTRSPIALLQAGER